MFDTFRFVVTLFMGFDVWAALGCIDYDPFTHSDLLFNDFDHSTCLPPVATKTWMKTTTLKVNPNCTADDKTIQLEIAVLGNKNCSDQPLFNVPIRNNSCRVLKSCHGYNLTPQLQNHTFCLLKCPTVKSNDNLFKIDLISGTYTSGWQLCGLRLFQGENFPRLIEVFSDGLDDQDKGGYIFRPEFTTNGMFVINSEKINVAYDRGMNVLSYDPLTGNHSFETFDIHRGNQANEKRLLDHVRSIPECSIVLMAVYDSSSPCKPNCTTALGLVGGTEQGIGYRDALAIIGNKGTCRPDWMTEVREPYNWVTQTGDVTIARVALPTRPDCGN